ncbi:hypothetical protein TCE0_015f02754 [Talaromyces pinophilus]|uniref:Uncharacterized protein n=1 Tax=Talaromyces pinophilus TaxID=128442 RepID=A0A6V8H2I9_TALPI|nr:hypothetical protein TCE0_015f02754 [Talaromyces pinophilus]
MFPSRLPKPENVPAVKYPHYREPSPEISAYSVKAAKHHILSSILPASIEGVCLETPTHIFLGLERFLESLQEQGRVLRYVYDLDSSTLKVMSPGNPIHSALSISFAVREERVMRHPIDGTVQNKIAAHHKTPDLAIYFVKPRGCLLTVVFEVGWAETYADLLSDAKQWLVKKSDEVNIVVIIDIKEDKLARREVRATPKSQERLRRLVAEFGGEEARLRDDIDSQPDVDSDNEMYREIKSIINVDDWVGPLSASLEIWELNGQTPQQRGPTYLPVIEAFIDFLSHSPILTSDASVREETTTCLAKAVAVAVRTVVVVAVVEELLFVEAGAIAEEDPKKKEAVVEAVENIVEELNVVTVVVQSSISRLTPGRQRW